LHCIIKRYGTGFFVYTASIEREEKRGAKRGQKIHKKRKREKVGSSQGSKIKGWIGERTHPSKRIPLRKTEKVQEGKKEKKSRGMGMST